MLALQCCLKALLLIPTMRSLGLMSIYSKTRPIFRLSTLASREMLTYTSPTHGLLLMRQRSHSSTWPFTTHLYSSSHHLSNYSETSDSNIDSSNVLDLYTDELVRLRGTPELVDRLENLASKHPGLELDINLFRLLYSFKLDKFQEEGLLELIAGNNVLVTTPTGSGKTLVGELAIYFALMMGLRVAYTTPLKALSNQKFKDFKERFGADRVGLLTGDIAINRGAAITIMTTEVFRNMVYDQDSQNQLSNLFMVCFDEFHFMNDPDRGTVWEESVISCPPSVRILALSATMGNVADIQGWISSIHGPTSLVASDYRPVPLRYMFAMKQGMFPLFRSPFAGPGATSGVTRDSNGQLDAGSEINPTIMKFEDRLTSQSSGSSMGGRDGRGRFGRPTVMNPNSNIAQYTDIVEELCQLQQVPAIVFIFSRAGCEQSAKMVMQTKKKLLNKDEIAYINNALSKFIRLNPDIPVAKENVAMLRAGVGVHHAGLIGVWKAFIEDLFNANMIKVLFATETLAAGVNMPARTTVITSVTKKINSEIIKLKTSQLLQMAGRAGRRGKDTEGTVVIMRNRFEDAKMGHRILTSPVDGIKSHFRTSYSLTVTLLETRTMLECKALIERGFSSYLMQQRIQKKSAKGELGPSDVDGYRSILSKYTLKGAREYLKIIRRLEKEQKNLDFLLEKMLESEVDLVQAIADYMPIGMGILLRNDDSGYFLGDVKWGANNIHNGFGVLTRDLKLFVVQKEHIRTFAEASDSIAPSTAQNLLDLVTMAQSWEEITLPDCKKPCLQGIYPMQDIAVNDKLSQALASIRSAPSFPTPSIPGAITRQRQVINELQLEYASHPIVVAKEEESVLQALKYVAKLKDPVEFVSKVTSSSSRSSMVAANESAKVDVYAWKMFQNVLALLQNFGALNGTEATELGQLVGSLSSDNELWLGLVLQHPVVLQLNEAELSGLICAVVVDGYKASNANFVNKPSENMKNVMSVLQPLFCELQSEQTLAGVDFPLYLSIDAAGLVESWVNGTSWRDLCKETSLDQGDVCRMFRRTVEVLREIPSSYGVPPRIAQLATDAFLKMDRFPVADIDPTVEEGSKETPAGVGFEFAGRTVIGADITDSTETVDSGGDMFEDLELDSLLVDVDYEMEDDEDDAFQGIDYLEEELTEESSLRRIRLEDSDGIDLSDGPPTLDDIELMTRLQNMETDVSSPSRKERQIAKDRLFKKSETIRGTK